MIRLELNHGWKMRPLGEIFQEAVVPGSVYTDLLRNGNMEDPFFKDNEIRAKKLMNKDYEYVCRFVFEPEAFEDCERILLHFDGLDTLADIYVNSQKAGAAFSMHRTWEYEVQDMLKPGENELMVVFHSPLKFLAEAYQRYGNIGNEDTVEGFMHLRKAHYMFGWDWGACLPDAGIFRPVSLIGIHHARIDNVRIHQEHGAGQVLLTLNVEAEINEKNDNFQNTNRTADQNLVRVEPFHTEPSHTEPSHTEGLYMKVLITDPDGRILCEETGTDTFTISQPRLWWPNGIGEQPLYDIKVLLYHKDELLDIWQKRIGLRTMTVRREKDQWGESFAHEINGRTIFAMGADYIPEDHLIGRTTRQRTYRLLEQCRLANFNSVRIWGGGYYPEDWFFDACDEMGLIVWEDFMFACSVYELTPEFEDNIREEFITNIKRIRHHASLGLWCGNNEMEMFVEQRCWVTKPSEVRDYLFMYEKLIPEVLKEHDPDTFYWPASPSSGGSFDKPNDPDRGDVHYWEVWHGNKPFSEYRKYYFRYISEFGFQSIPSLKTMEEITDDPKDLNLFSYVCEKHERNNGGNGKIVKYMQQMYLYPTSFSTLIYASQLLQADGIRYGVEHFRRNRGRCMGAVFWQLNDCWPVISWSAIDSCGRWKALMYYAKRFFAPCMISCEEESWMTQEADMNRQHFHFDKSIRLNVANETLSERTIKVRWALRNSDASVIRLMEDTIQVKAMSAVWLDKVELPEIDYMNEYVSYEAEENGVVISEGTVIFTYPKYFRYRDPGLALRIEGNEIVVTADAYAKSVEILNEEEDLVLSDNYFDMNAGERRVTVISGSTSGLRVRSVYDIH